MLKVLDASALLVYLEKEPSYEKVKELFVHASETEKNILMTAVNWGEVFYILVRDYGLEKAEEIQKIIDTFPIELVPADYVLAKQAALYKAQKKLPYADCFSAALAKLRKAELVTCDKDFKAVEGEIKIAWV